MTLRKMRRPSLVAGALALAVGPMAGCSRGEDPSADDSGNERLDAASDGQFTYALLDAVAAAARGRLGSAAELARDAELRAVELGDLEAALEAAVLPGLWRLWATGEAQVSVAAVDSAMERYPVGELTPPRRVDLILASFFADAGQVQRGRAFLSRYAQDARPRVAGEELQLPSGYYTSQGAIAMAERRYAEAIRALERAAAAGTDDPIAPDFRLGLAWERAGARDSAVLAYERFVEGLAPALAATQVARADVWAVPYALTSLGELYEAQGDEETAAEYFERFMELWRNADPPLQAEVLETRERLRALSGQGSTGG
jgi:tetratricopeptide (TPR) repeat protein